MRVASVAGFLTPLALLSSWESVHKSVKNFSFFGAPHTAVVTSDRALGAYGAVDCGGYVGMLMLACAAAMGLMLCRRRKEA